MDSEQDFFNNLNAELVAESQISGDYLQSVLTDFVLENFSEAGITQDMTLAHLETSGKNQRTLRLDAYAFDELDGSFHAVVSDYRSELETITKTDLDKLFGTLEYFITVSLDPKEIVYIPDTSEAIHAARQLYSSRNQITNIRLYVVTNARLSSRVRDLAPKKLGSIRVDYQVWDLNRLRELSQAQAGRSDLLVSLLGSHGTPIPALKAVSTAEEFDTYLLVLPGQLLASIFDQYGSRLLEGNVRSFLTAKGKVNSGIRETVLQQPERFLAYNNGLTATASEIEIAAQRGAVVEISSIKDLQIVNGGQTTATLWNILRTGGDKANSLRSVEVQVKLIVIPDELNSDLIPRVAQFANSQNKVQDSDLTSNSNYSRRVDELSKLVYAPPQDGSQIQTHWYFERARGAYQNERNRLKVGEPQRKFDRQNPKKQLFTKVQLAKYYMSWHQKPHIASLGDQKNFDYFTKEVANKFNAQESLLRLDDTYFKRLVGYKIMFDSLTMAVPSADWYSPGGGYRANCVIYGLSKLSFEIEKQGLAIDWALVWRDQKISPQLLALALEASKVSSNVLFSENRPQQNISEWAKKEACWQQVQSSTLAAKLEAPELVSGTHSAGGSSRKDLKEKSSALREIKIVEYLDGLIEDDWNLILADRDVSANLPERELVELIKRKRGILLTPRQNELIVGLLKRAWSAGVRIPELKI